MELRLLGCELCLEFTRFLDVCLQPQPAVVPKEGNRSVYAWSCVLCLFSCFEAQGTAGPGSFFPPSTIQGGPPLHSAFLPLFSVLRHLLSLCLRFIPVVFFPWKKKSPNFTALASDPDPIQHSKLLSIWHANLGCKPVGQQLYLGSAPSLRSSRSGPLLSSLGFRD